MATCTDCDQTQTVWVFDDGTVLPIGTDGCCACGAASFEVMERGDVAGVDADGGDVDTGAVGGDDLDGEEVEGREVESDVEAT